MKAIDAFTFNIKRSQNMIQLYENLKQEHPHSKISDLLRSALALSVGALDAYIHGKISENIVEYIKTCVKKHNHEKLKSTNEKTSKTPLEHFEDRVKAHLSPSVLLAACTMDRPFVQIRQGFNDYLYKRTFQSADDIEGALKIISQPRPWRDVATALEMTDQELTKQMDALAKRRNQIVHEGDRETSRKKSGKRRKVKIDEIKRGIDLIQEVVGELDKVIDKHLSSFHASANQRMRRSTRTTPVLSQIDDDEQE